MKKLSLKPVILMLLAGFLTSFTTLYAQSSFLSVEASQQITSFRFTDSNGNIDHDYAPVYNGAYNLGYLYDFGNGAFAKTSVGIRKAGATLVYDASNYQWDLQYFQFKIGGGYTYDMGRFSPYLGISFYYGYLLKANQRLNNENFDIKKDGSVTKGDAGIYLSPGVKFKLSESMSAYAEYSYLMGFKNIETTSDGQKATNKASMITVGLSFAIQ